MFHIKNLNQLIEQELTFAANLSEHRDSLIEIGFKLTIIKVFDERLPR